MQSIKPFEPEALIRNQTQPESSFRLGQSQSLYFPVRDVRKPYAVGNHTLECNLWNHTKVVLDNCTDGQ
jgi:hypothetical protein